MRGPVVARDLAAQPRRGEDLARVAQAGRVERAPDQLHGVQVIGVEHLRHVAGLVDADAVLAGDRAAVVQAGVQDRAGQFLGRGRLGGRGVVVEHQRVQVPVAGVEHVGHPDARLRGQRGDLGQDGAQRGPRHHPVLDDERRADPAHRGERGLAARPDDRALGRVVGRPDLGRACRLAQRTHRGEFGIHLRGRPVQLDDQHGPRPGRVVAAHRRLGRLDGQRVHHLDGGGHDAGRDDVGYRAAALAGGGVRGQQRMHHLGQRHQLDHDLGHDAERAFRAGERAKQVVAGGHAGAIAQPGQFPARRDDLQAHHVIHGEAVLEAVRPAGVLGHVAADRTDHLARRVRCVEQPERRRGLAHRQVGDAGLDHGPPAHRVDLQDFPHPGHHDQDAAGVRQRAAGQPGAAAAGHERHPGPRARGHDRRRFLGRTRQHHQRGHAAVRGEPVALVGAQLERIRDDVARATDVPHPRHQSLDGRRQIAPPRCRPVVIVPLSCPGEQKPATAFVRKPGW